MNFLVRSALMAVAMSLLGGCAAVVIGGAVAGGYYVGKDDRTVTEIADDTSITAAVNERYFSDDIVKARQINVDTFRGVVTLYGKVENQDVASRAVAIARGVKGVKQVVSKLTIGG